MTDRQITYFRCVAEQKSVQKASAALGKSPSTVSRAVRALEKELGAELLKRGAGGLERTAAGETVLEYGSRIQAGFAALPGSVWSEQDVRYLLAVRENGSISKAAEALSIAQPSLSQRLQGVEQELGQVIFLRRRGGIEETEFGRSLLDKLVQVWKLFEDMHAELEEYRQMKKETLRFGIPADLGACLLPVVLPALEALYPELPVQFRENNSGELERMAAGGKLDFALMHVQERQEGLNYELLSEDPFYLALPAAWGRKLPFAPNQELKAADMKLLETFPFIMAADHQKLRQAEEAVFSRSGISPKIRFTTKNAETAKRLCAAGMGMLLLPGSYLHLFSGAGAVECFRIDESLNVSWKLAAVYAKDTRLTRGAREFLKVLKNCFDVVSESRRWK